MAETLTLTRKGYGQVEDNHLSAKRSGHVYGQLPARKDIEILENGMFVHYDYAHKQVCFDKALLEDETEENANGPWYMVYNEEKLYDERKQMHKDYAMKPEQFYDGKMVPRVISIEVGDLYTTNMFVLDDETADGEPCTTITLGDTFAPNEEGVLKQDDNGFLQAVQLYTMPDMQPGVKLQCIKCCQ